MRESVHNLKDHGRVEESKARYEAVKREEAAYWTAVAGVDFEEKAAKKIAANRAAFERREEELENGFSVERKHLLSLLDSNVKRVLRSNPKTVEDELWKAAHFAKHGRSDRLEELLARRGHKVTTERDRDTSWTPIFFAARGGHLECVKILCIYGADAKIVDPRGQTPLHLAASFASREICGILLEHGAPIDAEDFMGLTACDCAEERRRGHDLCAFLSQFQDAEERERHKKRLAERRKEPGFLDVVRAARASFRSEHGESAAPKLSDYVTTAEGYERTVENDEALLAGLRKLEFKERAFGETYVGLLPTLASVAAAYKSRGDTLGTRSTLERIARIAAANYGLRHGSTAAAYNNLGEAFHELGEHEDAAYAFSYALKIAHEARGGRPFTGGEPPAEYAAIATPLRNLALHLFSRGDVATALPLLRNLLNLYEKLHDPALSPVGDLLFPWPMKPAPPS